MTSKWSKKSLIEEMQTNGPKFREIWVFGNWWNFPRWKFYNKLETTLSNIILLHLFQPKNGIIKFHRSKMLIIDSRKIYANLFFRQIFQCTNSMKAPVCYIPYVSVKLSEVWQWIVRYSPLIHPIYSLKMTVLSTIELQFSLKSTRYKIK